MSKPLGRAALLRCGAHAYLEFKALEGVLLLQGGMLREVPASRAEVFQAADLSASEKRLLMRFLKACARRHACLPNAAARIT